MTRIIYATDLHGNEILFDKLLSKASEENADAVIIGGDIAPKGKGRLTETVEDKIKFQADFIRILIKKFKDFKQKTGIHTFIMMGNDDFRANLYLLKEADKKGALKLMFDKAHKIGRHFIYGYSFVTVTPFMLKDWEKFDTKERRLSPVCIRPDEGIRTIKEKEKTTIEEDMENIINLTDPKRTIYVMHCPPYNTALDILGNSTHIGSVSIRKFIEANQPLLCLHGHIHESPQMSGKWKDKIGNTPCINPGSNPVEDKLRAVMIEIAGREISKSELING